MRSISVAGPRPLPWSSTPAPVATIGGCDGSCACTCAGAPGVSSTRIVLRALRTRYSVGCASDSRTRATAAPSTADACSSFTAVTLPPRLTSLRASPVLTFRKSTSRVSGSGLLTA